MNQKDGVYSAVVAFCEENNIDFQDGNKFDPSKEQRKEIVSMVASAMEAGEVDLSDSARAKHSTPEKLHSYCNGLVSNWLRKDKRLNGGVKYEIQNPGSRAGAGDDVVKELRKLKATFPQGSEQRDAIDQEIEKRLEKIRAEKAKSVEINTDLIPEELQHLIGE